MSSELKHVTRLHLKSFGLSEYMVKKIFTQLGASYKKDRTKLYAASEVKASIENKLPNLKAKPEIQEKLKKVLIWLNGELSGKSNIVTVDFLKNLHPEQRIEVLMGRIQELEAKEEQLTKETKELVNEAHIILKKA